MKNKDKKVCKICGNIIANPDNKTGFCPRCFGKGKTLGGIILGACTSLVYIIKKFKK